MRNVLLVASALGLLSVGAWFLACQAAEPPAVKGGTAAFGDLVGALKESPGCLGVETARTESGKLVIFAWFEDKKAVLKWYYSDVHQAVIKKVFPEARLRARPMPEVSDDSGPIMAIASITLADKPTKEKPFAFKQIAIELYQPITGGLSIGGRFAPDKVKALKSSKGKYEK